MADDDRGVPRPEAVAAPAPSGFGAWVEKEGLMILAGLVATGIISGGFVMGFERQKASELKTVERERTRKKSSKIVLPKPVVQKQVPVGVTWWERAIGVKSTRLSAGAAARSALLGGTILATAGTGAIVLGIAAVTGVSSLSELETRMSLVVPRLRTNMSNLFSIVPKEPTAEQIEQERQDIDLVASIFSEEDQDA